MKMRLGGLHLLQGSDQAIDLLGFHTNCDPVPTSFEIFNISSHMILTGMAFRFTIITIGTQQWMNLPITFVLQKPIKFLDDTRPIFTILRIHE